MKKLYKNTIKILLPLIIFCSFFTGCHDYVFSNIMDDVPPEEATVSGMINSITRYTVSNQEYLVSYSQNGLIYKDSTKSSHGQWNVYQYLPFELHHYSYYESKHIGQQILKVVSDENYLYLVTVSYVNDVNLDVNAPEMFYIYSAQINNWNTNPDWKLIDRENYSYKDGTYYYTNFNVFSTNTPNKSHRKAYIRKYDSEIYRLDGTLITPITPTKYSYEPAGNSKIDSVVYFNNNYYFLDAIACVTNETLTKNPTILYFAKDNSQDVYYTESISTNPTFALSCGEEVSCLAATKDSLLIGRADTNSLTGSYGGITKTNLNDSGIPGSEIVLFETNAAAQMPSSYLINTLLVVDPSKAETETDIYSTVTFRASSSTTSVNWENIGMWSYYPSRRNWNRE